MDKQYVYLKEIIIKKTVYSDYPEELAQTFEKAGAIYLHVVDLDGAKDGFAKNLETIKKN